MNTLQKKTQKPLLILRKAKAYLPPRNHKVSLQTTHPVDSGQDKQLTHQIKTKRDIGGWIENLKGDISAELEALDEQDHGPFRYVLRRERSLLPRPKFYSKCPDAESISLEYVGFILQHIVQQRIRKQEEENLKCKREKMR